MLLPTIRQLDEKLCLIALTPPLQGYDHFIGVWLHTGPPAVLVDVGPSATSVTLLRALEDLGIRHLDYLLLTHIHLDHAGGIGEIAAAFPQAQIVGHEKGLPHLAHPDRLWQSSLKSLGHTAEMYGAMQAVAEDRLVGAAALDTPAIQVIATPGHAPHHVSYAIENTLFAGEAGGVCLAREHLEPYMRPATPPRFLLEVALDSLDRLITRRPQKIAYSHFGLFAEAEKLLQAHRRQLLLWKSVISRVLVNTDPEDWLRVSLERLLRDDSHLEAFTTMGAQEKAREEGFLRNSIRGFIGYLQETLINTTMTG
jgi:glyoxylase-like metal-dependent hydrolase (beta-lactamase superfamily II)